MKVVLDASAAMAVAQKYSPSQLDKASQVLVPDVFVAEITNAVWKLFHFQKFSQADAEHILDRALFLPDVIVPASNLYRDAFALARSTGHPAYDMFYLALAKEEGATIWTLDKTFRKLVTRHGVAVA